jgi:hypothetical protein
VLDGRLDMRANTLLLSALIAVAPAATADPSAADSRHAHRHGAARLAVTLEGGALQITLDSPADNVLGFEHAPRTEGQRKTVGRVEAQLRRPAELLAPVPAADCRAEAPRVEIKLPPPGSRDTHSEVEAEWRWQCARPSALTYVDVGLFAVFPRLKELAVEVVTAEGQRKRLLRPGASRLLIGS